MSDHFQINMRTTRDISRALDLAVEHANRDQPDRRVTRAAVLRAALVAHLTSHPSSRVRATVARAGH